MAWSLAMVTLLGAVVELRTSILIKRYVISNFVEWCRRGDTVSTALIESMMNQMVGQRFVKKQQLQWTPQGVHLLLQTSTLPGITTFNRSQNGGRIAASRQP